MRDTYSLYEAKARLSALVRRVREGGRVLITVHGRPAVELKAVDVPEPGLASRLDQLTERMIVVRRGGKAALKPVARRPGALRRFLDERD